MRDLIESVSGVIMVIIVCITAYEIVSLLVGQIQCDVEPIAVSPDGIVTIDGVRYGVVE